MKGLLRLFIAILFLTSYMGANAAVITVASNSGLWNSTATWDLNRIPATNDIVVIPNGLTVRVNNNMYHGVPSYPLLEIQIHGTLQFVGTGQLNLECGSSLCTYATGSIPSTGSNSNQITIGPGLAPWKGASASITSGNCVYSTSCPLPVVLTEFEGRTKDGMVVLKWQSAFESNFDRYELERSLNGFLFETVYSVTGGLHEYSFTDYHAEDGMYYRLKMIDQDGTAKFSKVIWIPNIQESFSVFPNPCKESITIQSEYGHSFELVDYVGKIYKSGTLVGSAQLDLSDTPPGIYRLVLQGVSGRISVSLLVQ